MPLPKAPPTSTPPLPTDGNTAYAGASRVTSRSAGSRVIISPSVASAVSRRSLRSALVEGAVAHPTIMAHPATNGAIHAVVLMNDMFSSILFRDEDVHLGDHHPTRAPVTSGYAAAAGGSRAPPSACAKTRPSDPAA